MKWFFMALIVLAIAGIVGAGWFVLSQVNEMITLKSFKSSADEFHLTVLETKSVPGSFMQRVRVRCDKEMEIGIEVVDLKETGVREMHGKNGETFYRKGDPFIVGQSEPVHADGKSSICEILYDVTTTASNTSWYSRMRLTQTNDFSNGHDNTGVESKLPIAMVVSGVQTNWPDAYQRGSWIPLANLGDYKIMLIAK